MIKLELKQYDKSLSIEISSELLNEQSKDEQTDNFGRIEKLVLGFFHNEKLTRELTEKLNYLMKKR